MSVFVGSVFILGGTRSNLALSQLASLSGKSCLAEVIRLFLIVQLAVGSRTGPQIILVAFFVCGCINLHFHCIFLCPSEKLASLVMTFVSCEWSISLSDLRGAVARGAWVTRLRH